MIAARQILLVRHAEKPNGQFTGVASSGAPDDKSLTVRGWQRAGAFLVHFSPHFLFASHSSSHRPKETVEPLARKLGIPINLDFGKGDEAALVADAKSRDGVVLICWQHEYMSAVANAILGDNETAPQEWPADQFDVTWVFDLDPGAGTYRFSQKPQGLLAGDSK